MLTATNLIQVNNARISYIIMISTIVVTMIVEIYLKSELIFSQEILQPLLCLFYSCLLFTIVYNWVIISKQAATIAHENGRSYKIWLWLALLTIPPFIFAIAVMLHHSTKEE